MTLSVIGAGFGRTGTLSIKTALETLGLGTCHHMEAVFTQPAQPSYWRAAVDGQPVYWDEVFAGYRSAVDWPSAHFWHELSAHYPQAKILLSVRPEKSWWNSFSGTIKKLLDMRESIPDDYVREILDMAYEMIAVQTFGGAMDDERQVLAAFQRRIDEVTERIPSARLLVYDVAEGWEPLCRFLGLPSPAEPFPHVNNHEEFWQTFGGN